MSDIQLAWAILNRYADADGLTEEDVDSLRDEFHLSEDQAAKLRAALEDNYIDADERNVLEHRLFSNTVVSRLAGSDGHASLKVRASRLLATALDPATPADEWRRSLAALSSLSLVDEQDSATFTRIQAVGRLVSARIPKILRSALKETQPEPRLRFVAFMNEVAMGGKDRPTFLTRAQATQWLRHLELVVSNSGNDPKLRVAAVSSLARFWDIRPSDLPGLPPALFMDSPIYWITPSPPLTPRQQRALQQDLAKWIDWKNELRPTLLVLDAALNDPDPAVRAAAREATGGS